MEVFCPTCKDMRKIINIKREKDREEKELSCGHKIIEITLKEEVKLTDSLRLKKISGGRDERGKPISEVKSKVSDEKEHRISVSRSGEKTRVLQVVWDKEKKRISHIHAKELGVKITVEKEVENEEILKVQSELMSEMLEVFKKFGYKTS